MRCRAMYDTVSMPHRTAMACGLRAIRFTTVGIYLIKTPDRGIYMVRTQASAAPGSKPVLVKAAEASSTPARWDEDGRAIWYMDGPVHVPDLKSVLSVSEMTPDGTELIGEDVLIFDGHDAHPTVEGPKFCKRNGYY